MDKNYVIVEFCRLNQCEISSLFPNASIIITFTIISLFICVTSINMQLYSTLNNKGSKWSFHSDAIENNHFWFPKEPLVNRS